MNQFKDKKVQVKDCKYVQFPLSLLPKIITDKEDTIKKILFFGIYHFSKNIESEINSAIKQFLYFYYRNKSNLTDSLIKKIGRYVNDESLVLDEDYFGFKGEGESFNPENEINDLLKICITDIELKEEILEFHKVYKASCFFTYEKKHNLAHILKVGKEIEIKYKEPILSVRVDLLRDFYFNDKDEYDLIQLVAYLAIRSILGKKKYTKANKKHILYRMLGYASIKNCPENFPENCPEDILALFTKYSHRCHMDKLINYLELNWNIVSYGMNVRGIYFAMKQIIDIDELALIVEKKKMKSRIAELKQQKLSAKRKALEILKKNQRDKENENFF